MERGFNPDDPHSKPDRQKYLFLHTGGWLFQDQLSVFFGAQKSGFLLILYTVSGKGCLIYEGKEYTLTEGQCFFIHCEQYHKYYTDRDSDWEFLWIHFNGSSSLGYYHEFVRNGFRIIPCQDTFFMERTIWRVIALHQRKDLTTEAISSNLINSLLTELLIETATNSADTFLIPDYVRDIIKDIDKNYRQELSLSRFEALCHRSRYHISKEFKKYIGITVNEYIITTRISHAKDLLKYSDLSVNDITFEIGFNNVTHFINLFKARENLTPLAYRKAWTVGPP